MRTWLLRRIADALYPHIKARYDADFTQGLREAIRRHRSPEARR